MKTARDFERGHLGFNFPVCYNMSTYYNPDTSMIQRVEHPVVSSLPIFTLQMLIVLAVNHILMLSLKRLHQPRIVADILGGVLLGPSFFGQSVFARKYIFPFRNMLTLETLANLGLVYYMFVVGLELDFKPVIRAGRKALSIALVGIFVAIPIGWALHYFLILKHFPQLSKGQPTRFGPIFWGIALATTNFSDLARILADLKLLHSEIGRIALSSAVISDLCSWFFLIVAMAVVGVDRKLRAVFAVAFVVFCVFVFRPALLWVFRNTCTNTNTNKENTKESTSIKHNNYNELHVCLVLSMVMLFGFVTDICGSHSILGPFVLGAILPKDELKKMLIVRIQHFVSFLMMPLFFLVMGVRTKMKHILHEEGLHEQEYYNETSIYRVVGVIIVAFASKIVTTFVTALINKLSAWDSLLLGVLMNTKGLLALIILSSGKDLKILDNRTFAVMMIANWVMTVPVGPFLAFTYKYSTRRSTDYKLRNIQSVGLERELRILTCSHSSSTVSGIIDLLEASNPSTKSPICIFAIQLVELTGHTSAMLIVNDACRTNSRGSNKSEFDYFNSNNAFEKYAMQRDNVSVQTLTGVSTYNNMHAEICNLAKEKYVNLIIIPFHKQATMDGAMEESSPSLKDVHNNVICNAPCSVAVFVDRGLSSKCRITSPSNGASSMCCHHYAVFFIGGADDREALTYAWRMAGHPRVNLKVVRFIVIPKHNKDDNDNAVDFPEVMEDTRMEKQLDDLHVDGFRLKLMDHPSIQYLEEMVNSWKEILNVIRAMEGESNLYIVGRRHGSTSPTATFSDCYSKTIYELGPLGDALVVSSSFKVNTSILVVQQGDPVYELEANNDSKK